MGFDFDVLIVDDHPLQHLHVESVLQDAGFHRIRHAMSANQAILQLQQQGADLVITDLDMPDGDGIQLIDHVTGKGQDTHLAISSSCDSAIMRSVERMAQHRGAPLAGLFPKPFLESHALQLRSQLMSQGSTIEGPLALQLNQTLDATALTRALESEAIHGRFQPKIDVLGGQVVGAEVLARWDHPVHGLIPPCEFLPAIHRHRLERLLLLRMLEDGLNAHLYWRQFGHKIPISINLPLSLLESPDLPGELAERVAVAGVGPSQVIFELLEDEPIGAADLFHRGVSRLRLKGFGLSQDDFGRGHSTMYTLLCAPFTEIKVDRAFVAGAWEDAARRAILSNAIALGHSLGIPVTAEGAETEQDLQCLRQVGCDRAQGYPISPPTDTKRFLELVQNLSTIKY